MGGAARRRTARGEYFSRGLVPLCPDAVFEVRSWTDELADLRAKMRSYLANGARLAVIIDPERRTVKINAPDRDPQIVE